MSGETAGEALGFTQPKPPKVPKYPNISDRKTTILGEDKKHLVARAETRSITGTEDDIVIFLRAKLKVDTIPDAMDKSLEKEIKNIITATISKMWAACSIFKYLSLCAKRYCV